MDGILTVSEACDMTGEIVARMLVARAPELDLERLKEVISTEIWFACQDCAIGALQTVPADA